MLLAVEDANSGQAVYVGVSVGVGVDAYVDVGVDGNLVLSVPNFRLIFLKVVWCECSNNLIWLHWQIIKDMMMAAFHQHYWVRLLVSFPLLHCSKFCNNFEIPPLNDRVVTPKYFQPSISPLSSTPCYYLPIVTIRRLSIPDFQRNCEAV